MIVKYLQIFLVAAVDCGKSGSSWREKFRIRSEIIKDQIKSRFNSLYNFIGSIMKLYHSRNLRVAISKQCN